MKRSAGFTLLEMLLVLALLGVLMTLVGGTLMGANRAWSKGERYGQQLDELRAGQNFLRQALQRTLPIEFQDQDARVKVFEGEAQRLRFCATLPLSLGGGILVHRLQWRQGDTGTQLWVSFDPVPGAPLSPGAAPQAQLLLHNAQGLRLAYRGIDPQGRATGWLDRWPWPARLPAAVRLEVREPADTGWLSQTIALRLDLGGSQEAP